MKKSILILALCFVLMFAVAAVSAQDAEVPAEEPVAYKDYLIFYGWDIDDDGIADYGYYYDKFNMPEKDVELKAICIGASWGSTCKGCHLHGKPGAVKLNTFTYEQFPVVNQTSSNN